MPAKRARNGGAENAGPEKQDLKMKDQISGHENAGPEIIRLLETLEYCSGAYRNLFSVRSKTPANAFVNPPHEPSSPALRVKQVG